MNFTNFTNNGIIILILSSIANLIFLICGTFCFKNIEKFHVVMWKMLFLAIGGYGWFVSTMISDLYFADIYMPAGTILFYIISIITAAFGLFAFVYLLRNIHIRSKIELEKIK